MGFRLAGPPLRHARGADIISDATPLGALQVPASGQPILLMADRQTDRRLSEHRHGHRAPTRASPDKLAPGDCDRVRGLLAARGDGGADRARASADGRRGGRA